MGDDPRGPAVLRRLSIDRIDLPPVPSLCYPLITPIGRHRATFLDSPAR
jgi:hypothetical protein